jgi:Tol biopolymer transport system component
MFKVALLAALWGTMLPAFGKNRILFNRIGPSGAELFLASADGSGEQKLLTASGFDYNASFSADGQWIVFTSERHGSSDIFRVRVDGFGLERLTDHPAYDDQAAFSPDGKHVAFVSTRGSGSNDIWILDLASRKARNLTDAPGADFRPSWSPDGKWIAFSSDRNEKIQYAAGRWEHVHPASLYVIQANGKGLRRLTSSGKFAGSPKWSADGKRVAFYEMDLESTWTGRGGGAAGPAAANAVSQIVSIEVATGARTEHTAGPGVKVSPQFLSGDRIGYLRKSGPQQGLAFTSGPAGAGGQMRSPSWSPDGTRAVYQKFSFGQRRQNQPLFSIRQDFELAWSAIFPVFSRDGRLALVGRRGVAASDTSLEVMDADGTDPKRIFTEKGSMVMSPDWSPDGQWIAFGAGAFFTDRDKPARVMMVRADGTDARELTKGPANTGFPSWSPDGKRLVYRAWSDKERGLRILNLEDSSAKVLTTDYDNFPVWSPLGDRIAFTSFRNNDFDIYTIRPDGTGLQKLTTAPGNDSHCAWSPDGKYLLFSSSRLGFKDEAPLYDGNPQPYGELFVMKADGSEQRPLTDNCWEDATPAWQPAARGR